MRLLVASVLSDAGGAQAVAPVLALLAARGALGPVWAGPAARAALAAARIPHAPLDPGATPSGLLARYRPTLLLTGTSWGDGCVEPAWIEAARSGGIPTVSVIDFWANYASRFVGADGDLVLPDVVAVPDQVAATEAVADGLPADRVLTTGNPHYESLIAGYRGFGEAERSAFRDGVGMRRGTTMVLFASQPIRALYGDRLGYTEDRVLALVHDAVSRVGERLRVPMTLVVRPHPREGEIVLPASSDQVRVVGTDAGDPVAWALAADLVLGMNSALLLQAAMLGARVVSVQPDLQGPDLLPSNRLGASESAYRADELVPAIERVLAGDATACGRSIVRLRAAARGAAGRLLDCIVSQSRRIPSEVNS